MLHHFKVEDHKKAQEYLYWFNYSLQQIKRNTEEGNFELAKRFIKDMNLYYSELERMAKKKQEEDKITLLLNQTDGQLQVDSWKEQYS